MVLPNEPLKNAGLKYVNGLGLIFNESNNQAMTVSSGAARDSTNTNDIILDSNVTISLLTVGAGGIDAGPLAASSTYAVYVIASSTSVFTSTTDLGGGPSPNPLGPSAVPAPANPYPASAILSLNASTPILPVGYDMYRRVGWVRTDASSHFLGYSQYGNGETRTYAFYNKVIVKTGAITSSFVQVPLVVGVGADAGVPCLPASFGLELEVLCDILYTPAGATDVAEFMQYVFSPPANGNVRFGTGVAGAQVGSLQIPSQSNGTAPTILAKATSGTCTLSVSGFVDILG